MKLPNGYGSVKKLSGKRRKPWIVQKTQGWSIDPVTQKNKQVKITIGYYETRSAALQALAEYNENPYDPVAASITFSELYDKFSAEKYPTISDSNVKGYKAAFNLCAEIADVKFSDVKLSHLQYIVDHSGKNSPTLRKLKVLLSQMYEYAIIHEIVGKEKNCVEYLNISKAGNPDSRSRTPFTDQEIDMIWKTFDGNEYMQIILMLIYSGVRISELLDLKKEDVHIDEHWFFVKKSKTDSGVRAVPIADKTMQFFQYWYNKNDCEYLLSTPDGEHFAYRNYYDSYWKPFMDQLNMTHSPHDTRHTCISLLARAHVYQTTIKKIVGHSGAQSLTEKVYTHLDINELLEAINLI